MYCFKHVYYHNTVTMSTKLHLEQQRAKTLYCTLSNEKHTNKRMQ